MKKLILFFPALCIPDHARGGELMFFRFDPTNVPEILSSYAGAPKLSRRFVETASKKDGAEFLSVVRGWMNYFGAYNKSAMIGTLNVIQRRLIKWAMCMYKRFRGHRRRAEEWLYEVKKREPTMFAHWALG